MQTTRTRTTKRTTHLTGYDNTLFTSSLARWRILSSGTPNAYRTERLPTNSCFYHLIYILTWVVSLSER